MYTCEPVIVKIVSYLLFKILVIKEINEEYEYTNHLFGDVESISKKKKKLFVQLRRKSNHYMKLVVVS